MQVCWNLNLIFWHQNANAGEKGAPNPHHWWLLYTINAVASRLSPKTKWSFCRNSWPIAPQDWTRIDPNFGTAEEMKELVEKTHEKGMKFMDLYIGYFSSVQMYNIHFWISYL